MKIALFGASLDPIHNGHLEVVRIALKYVDKVIVIPAFSNPLKIEGASETPAVRLELARLAFEHMQDVRVSDIEIKNGATMYAYELLNHFSSISPSDEHYFLIGSDLVAQLNRWAQPHELGKHGFLVVPRPMYEIADVQGIARQFEKEYGANFIYAKEAGINMSSTLLRLLISFNRAKPHMPQCVYEQVMAQPSYHDYRTYVKSLDMYGLDDERKEHIFNVAVCAIELAQRYGESTKNAAIAALLHDIAKCLKDRGVSGRHKVPAAVRHAATGAWIARKKFGVHDKDILKAIRYHTTGRPNMSCLEKIIYIADSIEPLRTFNGVDRLRQLAFEDLDKALLATMQIKMDAARAKYSVIDEMGQKALEYYSNQK